MNSDHERLELIRCYIDGTATPEAMNALQDSLRSDPAFRRFYARYASLDSALGNGLLVSDLVISDLVIKAEPRSHQPSSRWYAWRPLTAAVAGIVFGMLCTSVLFGYVAQLSVQKIRMPVFDPGFEGLKPLDKGLPHGPDEWGARSAEIVSAEKGVQPLQGRQMLRLQPSLLGKLDEKLYAHAYQVIDLRSLPTEAVSAGQRVLVSASFCKTTDSPNPRNYIRLFALNESPNSVTENFWSKEENEEIVAMAQRFETKAVKSGWHTVSVEMPLPPSAQSLIIIFSANSPKQDASASYLDDVQASLLSSENPLP